MGGWLLGECNWHTLIDFIKRGVGRFNNEMKLNGKYLEKERKKESKKGRKVD